MFKKGKGLYSVLTYFLVGASQVVLVVKNLPAKEGDERHTDKVRSLGQEDPLEEGMATHSSILPWRIR